MDYTLGMSLTAALSATNKGLCSPLVNVFGTHSSPDLVKSRAESGCIAPKLGPEPAQLRQYLKMLHVVFDLLPVIFITALRRSQEA